MDMDTLAQLVDDRVHTPAADRTYCARLYGVRLVAGPEPGCGGADLGSAGPKDDEPEIVLDEIGQGDARDVSRRARPPAGLAAIALATTAWAAPMEDDLPPGYASVRPSRHPDRRRMHVTFLVGGDGEDVSVLREPGQDPLVVRGGIGAVRDLLVRCWNRRQDAPAVRRTA